LANVLSTNWIQLQAKSIPALSSQVAIQALSPAGQDSAISLTTGHILINGSILLEDNAAGTSLFQVVANSFSFSHPIEVANGGTGADNTTQAYTPSLTNVTNVTTSSALSCKYFQVGNMVTVIGAVTLTPTLPTILTEIDVSFPVASTIITTYNVGGTCGRPSTATEMGFIYGDTVNHRARIIFTSQINTSHQLDFTFSYLIQ
jgi:hypothetical protein